MDILADPFVVAVADMGTDLVPTIATHAAVNAATTMWVEWFEVLCLVSLPRSLPKVVAEVEANGVTVLEVV